MEDAPVWKAVGEDTMIYARLAFEYGIVLSDAAKDLGIAVDRALVMRMEEVLNAEFPTRTPEYLATHMIPFVMAALQPKEVEPITNDNKNKAMAKGTKKGGMKKGGKGC